LRFTMLLLTSSLASLAAHPMTAFAAEETSVDRGRYVAIIGGCNDCHTAGYAANEGKVPEADWLKGDILGWRGPWGTTYPANLRLRLHEMTEDEWVKFAKTFKTRPPMPWPNVNQMTETDLRSFYRYVASFTDLGNPAPAALPPGEEPHGPYVQFPAPPQ
jgi:hypothetical protein